jgi:NADH-quinone oxidoreductase subunit H
MMTENFIINLIILINLTLIVGVLPLIERKYLSLVQRRVGPKFVGYKGRLQFIADALKMFLKQCLRPNRTNAVLFFAPPMMLLSLCYFYYINTYWGFNMIYMDIDFNLLLIMILAYFFNFYFLLAGIATHSKYATLASLRTVILMFCLELLIGILFVNFYFYWSSFNFSLYLTFQEETGSVIMFFLSYSVLLIVFLMEINRCPFDLCEAESELISGFHVEYGAFFFGLFYLSEYFHLFFTGIVIIVLLIGA